MFRESGTESTVTALADEITRLGAQISAATCRWLGLIAEFDAREGHRAWGQASCADWVAWRCSVSPVTAREHVRVGRWLAGQPVIRAAFAVGELSYSKVRALSRLERVSDPEELLALARHATAAQLERILAAGRRVTRAEAAAAQAARYLHVHIDDQGCAVIRGRVPGDDGALLLRALERALEALDEGAEHDSAESRESLPARNADALVLLADTALGAAHTERNAGDRAQVVVHVDVATLATEDTQGGQDDAAAARPGPGEQRCHLDEGAAVAAETARRLCCDAGIVTSVERDGQTVSVGRKTRAIPPALRRALRSRDACCGFPGCNRRRWLDAHHIEHWAHGGTTSLDNLVHLCRHHHRLVHEGGYALSRSAGGETIVRTPDGRRLAPVAPTRRGSCDRLVAEQRERGIAPGPDAPVPISTDRGYDLAMAADSVVMWTTDRVL